VKNLILETMELFFTGTRNDVRTT